MSEHPAALLVADDDQVARELLGEALGREGYRVSMVASGEECLRLAGAREFDLALVDLRMPGLDGLGVLKRLAEIRPGLPVVILTAFASIDTAVEAVNSGASDYLSKPFRMDEIKVVVERTLAARRLAASAAANVAPPASPRADLVGQSHQMAEIYTLIARVASLDTTVLIQGETGTGKELVARAIHATSARAAGPFVAIDCAALPQTLFESELFLETSAGGTCFLDEVAELTAPLQAKLLRALQERAIRRVGVRIVAATNRDLQTLVGEGGFRDDLYYRLNVVPITVPPLRERAADIPLLAHHFLEKFALANGRPVKRLAPDSLTLLTEYPWPGNVRELEHVVERAVALAASDTLLPHDLPPHVRREPERAPQLPASSMTLEAVKHWYVHKVLDEAGGNKVRAADILGIDRRTLYRILERQATEDD